MGLFGSSGDTGLNLGGSSGDYGSKLRSPSMELDLSSDPAAGATSSLDLAGGDFEKGLQIEQQKATLTSQVHISLYQIKLVILRLFFFQIHNLTEICWETCLGNSSIGSSLGSRTESCVANCAGRFVVSIYIDNFSQKIPQPHFFLFSRTLLCSLPIDLVN